MTKKNSAIINPFKQNSKHDFVFNVLMNGVTFEQLREKLTEKYNDVHTSSRPNVRMYIQNIRNKNIPVSLDHRTSIYKIGNPETPKTKTRKNADAPKTENTPQTDASNTPQTDNVSLTDAPNDTPQTDAPKTE